MPTIQQILASSVPLISTAETAHTQIQQVQLFVLHVPMDISSRVQPPPVLLPAILRSMLTKGTTAVLIVMLLA